MSSRAYPRRASEASPAPSSRSSVYLLTKARLRKRNIEKASSHGETGTDVAYPPDSTRSE